MYKRDIVAMIIDQRNQNADKVQKIMTGWGCMIKTRLGLHDGVLNECTPTGMVILEMVGESEKIDEFVHKINLLKGVQAKRMTLELPQA